MIRDRILLSLVITQSSSTPSATRAHHHVRCGVCARRLSVEAEEEAELGAGRAEQELREPPPVGGLGQVQEGGAV